MQTATADLARKAQTGVVAQEEALKAVESMLKRAENLKRKVRGHCMLFAVPHSLTDESVSSGSFRRARARRRSR